MQTLLQFQFHFLTVKFSSQPSACPIPVLALNVLPDENLQSMFRHVLLTQNRINQVDAIEEGLVDLSDFMENQIWPSVHRSWTTWERSCIRSRSIWVSYWQCNCCKSPGASSSISRLTVDSVSSIWIFTRWTVHLCFPVVGSWPTQCQSATTTGLEQFPIRQKRRHRRLGFWVDWTWSLLFEMLHFHAFSTALRWDEIKQTKAGSYIFENSAPNLVEYYSFFKRQVQNNCLVPLRNSAPRCLGLNARFEGHRVLASQRPTTRIRFIVLTATIMCM